MTNYGEELAYEYLIKQGYTVEDVSQNPAYYGVDIDLIATKDDEEHTIEVKWDRRMSQTGNMFIETTSSIEEGKEGWFMFCRAELLYYGDSVNRIFYIIRMDDLREYLENNITEQRNAPDYRYNGTLRKRSRGEIVSISDFTSKYQVEIVYV